MRRSRRRTSRRETNTELNITAFMNLMVVLIPFLLLTAVFSQVSILELDLPGSASESEQEIEDETPGPFQRVHQSRMGETYAQGWKPCRENKQRY